MPDQVYKISHRNGRMVRPAISQLDDSLVSLDQANTVKRNGKEWGNENQTELDWNERGEIAKLTFELCSVYSKPK